MKIKIGKKFISQESPVYVIAEAGVNHNGDVGLAKKLIEQAKEAGADCVKFQTFKGEDIVTKSAPKADYQLKVTDPIESQLAMLKKLELPKEAYLDLMAHCRKVDIQFLSTPYGFHDVDFLDGLGVEFFKVASGQCTELPLLEYIAKKKKPIILSTGMTTMEDCREAVKAIRRAGLAEIVLLQCTTNYPSLIEDANLRVIPTLIKEFDIPIGYSDHTTDNVGILGSIALGACVIEKHFTLDRNMTGPDHSSSVEPIEFKKLIEQIRRMEKALGSSEKFLTAAEKKNATGMKRSLTAVKMIPRGTQIGAPMITFKRPASGMHPKRFYEVVGKKALIDIPADTIITEEMVDL